MKSLNTKLGVVGIMLICFTSLNAQTFTVQSGKWSSPSTWSGGIVPDSTAGSIIVNHKIRLVADTVLKVDELILNDTLIVEAGSTLLFCNNALSKVPDLQILTGGLKVYGRMVCLDSTTTSGTSVANTFFYDGSTYEHRFFSVAGTPPVATWSVNSTLEITGYKTTKTLNNVLWSQSFGNVIYNCPSQTSNIEMAGRLKDIRGNFLIQNTNASYLRLSLDATNSTTITIGGNLIIEGKSRVWFSRAATTSVFVKGSFKILSTATANSYVTTTGNCDINVDGDFEMNTTSALRFASATASGRGILRVKQNFTFQAGTIDVTAGGDGLGTIELNGSTPQLFSSLGDWATGVNFSIKNSAGVSALDNSKVEANVVVSSNGKLILPETNFTLQGDLTIENSGIVKSNQGTLTLAGPVNQSLSLDGDTLHNVVINKLSGTSISFSNAALLSGALSVLSTNTIVNSNGNLTLLSFSDDGNADASVNTLPTGSSILGDVTVQRFMSGEGRIYRYISIPVSDASVSSLMDDFPITGTFSDPSTGSGIRPSAPSFYYYDETLSNSLGWIAYPSAGAASENQLAAGRGYSAFIRDGVNATNWDLTGTLNQGDITLPTTFTDTGNPSNDGWNLVGNPYPASIDWNAASGWDKLHIDNGIAVRDNGSGSVLYWDGAIGSLGSGRIAKGQSFWVKTNDINPQLTIKETAKTNLATSFYRTKTVEPDYLEVNIQSSQHNDKTYLRIRDQAIVGYDSLDVAKFSNDIMNVYFEAGKTPLAISAIDQLDCSLAYPIRLSFVKKSDGSFVQSPIGIYQLTVETFGLFADEEIILHDRFKSFDFNTNLGSYSFSVTEDSASYSSSRFSLHFHSAPLSDSVSIHADSILCDTSPVYKIEMKNPQQNTRYKVFANGDEMISYLPEQKDRAIIKIATTELSYGMTNLEIKAHNLCHSKQIDSFNVWKQKTNTPNVYAELACNSETTTLRIENVKGEIAFNWFDYQHNLLAQTQDSTFVVPIQKPTTFYASSIFNHGCVSGEVSVHANVIQYDKPTVTENNGILYSNYSNNNHWSLDGKEIVDTDQPTFQPAISGNYFLTIKYEGCVDSTSYFFIYQDEICRAFPNPVEQDLQVIAPKGEPIIQIEIMNASGQTAKMFWIEPYSKAVSVEMSDFASGLYSLNIITTKNRYEKRIVKK